MLKTLRKIVQEVNTAESLDYALRTIVEGVKCATEVDVCSIYLLVDSESQSLVLRESDGLHASAIGKVSMDIGDGLVGLVARRGEPVNLSNAPSHPNYRFFEETGEEAFHSFLGVPILQNRRMMGVLVIQQREERQFDDDYVSFLVTLAAQLAAAIRNAEITGGLMAQEQSPSVQGLAVDGIAGAPGVAMGVAVVMFPEADLTSVPDRSCDSIDSEIASFNQAVALVQQDILTLKERMGGVLPAEDQVLFDAYTLLLGSDSLTQVTVTRIQEGNWAPGALRKTILEHARAFEDMDDAYLSERAADIRDLGQRILDRLLSVNPRRTDYPKNTVLVGKEISATQLAEVPFGRLSGIICTTGSSSSHVAILARALGVPAVMGATGFPVGRVDGRKLIVDGYLGRVHLQPTAAVCKEYERLAKEEKEMELGLLEEAAKPAITSDGHTIPIYVNSGLLAEMMPGRKVQADGIGLYRTELPFMLREHFPGESEQTALYENVLKSFPNHPVTLRTLDVGGDKPLSYFPIEEDNPFLGYRGIRITLDHPDIFLTQLRAMLLANRETGNLQVLFPMIGSMHEINESLGLLERAQEELREEGHFLPKPKVGVMIEVPSAVYLAEHLAKRVDFLSVGTNDLVQYLLAVDRNNSRVADLYDDNHPAVLCALHRVVAGAKVSNTPVSICGEMASDPASVILLLGLGIDSLSVNLASLPRIKWVIRTFSRLDTQALFRQAMQMQEAAAIRAMTNAALEKVGLGGLVRPGKY